MGSYFPKALWYKEWREHGWKALFAATIISLSPIADLFLLWSRTTTLPSAASYATTTFWNHFNSGINTFVESSTTGFPALGVVVVLAIILVTAERSSGSLWYILSTPVQRSEWVRTKFLFGLAIIYSTYTVLLIWNSVVAVFDPTPVGFAELLRWWFYMLAVQGAVYAVSFVTALCVTNAVLVFIGTFLVLGVPAFVSGYVHEAVIAAPERVSAVVQYLTSWIDSLSPFSLLKHNLLFSNPFLYWYMAMIPLLYGLAQILMRRVQAEHLNSLLTLPKLWYLVLTGFSAALGSVFATIEMALLAITSGYSFYSLFVPLSVLSAGVIWGAFYGIVLFGVRSKRRRRVA